MQHVRQALEDNGYPRYFIEQSRPRSSCCPSADQVTINPAVTIVLQCVQLVSEMIVRIVPPLYIRTYFHPHMSLRNILSRAKDVTSPEGRASMVYSIPFADCPVTYVGQTGRTLNHRIQEHHRAWRNADVTLSAITEHSILAGQAITWSEVFVLDCSD